MEHVLSHFKGLKKQAKAGDFNYHPGIQTRLRRHGTKLIAIIPKLMPLLRE
jgi:hypothetical protein